MSLILGIESSCDETAVAVVRDGFEVLSSAVASQIASHAKHGGVVPELAAREHLTALQPVLDEALTVANVTAEEIDAIAVTQGPGLMPALLVGLNFAKGLAIGWRKPLYGVNHFVAHIYSAFLGDGAEFLLDKNSYPMLAIVVSGGHTSLMLIESDGRAIQLGYTLDDAAGEALDKAAKLLHLGYPGGPIMQRTAEGGDIRRFEFPRPLTGTAGKALSEENRFNFSFSGIKTSMLYQVQKLEAQPEGLSPEIVRDLAAGFQEAVVDVLVRKALDAVRKYNAHSIVAAGGVACNGPLRDRLTQCCPKGVRLRLPERKNCTDNAAMVGGLGFHHFKANPAGTPDALRMDAFARLPQVSQVPFLG